MSDEIARFIQEFKEAIQATAAQRANAERAKKAKRLASGLAKSLSNGEQVDPIFLDLERRVAAIEQKLEQIANRKTDLEPFTRKARAMVDLEGILSPEAINSVQILLEQAGTSASGTRRRGRQFQFDLGAECTECKELLVGGRRGSPRWGHIRGLVTRHEQRDHEGFSADERLDLRAASTQLEDGTPEIRVKRYRIFRIEGTTQ